MLVKFENFGTTECWKLTFNKKNLYTLSVFLYVLRILEAKLNTERVWRSQNEQITDK